MTGGRGRAPFWADSCAGFLQSVGLCSPKAGALLHPSPFLLPGLAVNPRTRQDPEWGTAFQHRLLSLELQQSDEFPVTGTPPAAPQKPPPEEGGRRAGLTLASLLDARKPGGRREAGQGSHISSRHASFSSWSVQPLKHGLSSVVGGLSCSVSCGIFLDLALNPCLLHWQILTQLCHQGSP